MDSNERGLIEWRDALELEARYEGTLVPDIEGRIERIKALWSAGVSSEWLAACNDSRWRDGRYRRGDLGKPNPGEHQLEHAVLEEYFDRIQCFGGTLVDGLSAVPLGAGPRVEADMLLLAKNRDEYELLLVEVKTTANSLWYAVVENLRQLALFSANTELRDIFQRRNQSLRLPRHLRVVGLILAPESYYTAEGQKREALAPAMRLVAELSVDIRFAVWTERPQPTIELLASR